MGKGFRVTQSDLLLRGAALDGYPDGLVDAALLAYHGDRCGGFFFWEIRVQGFQSAACSCSAPPWMAARTASSTLRCSPAKATGVIYRGLGFSGFARAPRAPARRLGAQFTGVEHCCGVLTSMRCWCTPPFLNVLSGEATASTPADAHTSWWFQRHAPRLLR